ncbi:MAG: transcription termination/antitermination protein NusA [Clostridia bacterium]|nr:transcription termination/antitermination protein NusA [Clostridia bacterium]
MVNKEFFLALDAICRERRLDKALIIASIEAGLASAYKKELGESREVRAKLNEETGRVEFFAYQTVVEGEPQADSELSLEEAQDIKPDAKIGDIIGDDITPKELSRIAAQTGKQVITQRINEAIREQTAAEMNDKEGELVLATVRRIENNVVYVEIINSQMEGVMNMMDQVRTETYNVGDKLRVYVKKVREGINGRNAQVVVSRSCAGFVKKLFEIEVPELRSGLVKVKSIVREAGNRTKMAVYTEDPNIDPLAACIGPRGERVNNVVNELNGEKVDVILYTSNLREYIIRALNPLKSVVGLRVDEEAGKARVIVADDKLSLAIGKGGMNARLAAKLTGIKLDIVAKSADPTFNNDDND